ncbi:MAG: hypothetical protein M3356_00455 [Actinomycetota bacterium]|nr:hypothetical protein [Actinomycetota bacterium]
MRTLALLVLAGAFTVTLLPGPWGDESVTDLFLYRSYADLFLAGSLPYRDVAFEYPPLAAPLLALPGVPGSGDGDYRLAFAALALGLAAILVMFVGGLARRTGGDPRRAMLAAAVFPLFTGAMLRTHFDLAPVALTLGALLLLASNRPRTGLAVLGAAVMTKGFPLVVAPVAVAWLVAHDRRREAVEGMAALALVVVTVAGAAAVASPGGAADAVAYHLNRPAQVESAPALVLLGLDGLGAGRADLVHSHGSEGVRHPASPAVVALFGVLLIGAVCVMTVGVVRGVSAAHGGGEGSGARTLVLAALGAVAAFAAFGKVLSPQFLIWLVPLAALAFGWRRPALGAAATAAIALTLVEFPAHYPDVVDRDPAALWLVAVRDAMLALAVALVARELYRGEAPLRRSKSAPPPVAAPVSGAPARGSAL